MAATRERPMRRTPRKPRKKTRGIHGQVSNYDPAWPAIVTRIIATSKQPQSDEDIARYLRISRRSLYRYKADHPEFDKAFHRGDEQRLALVEDALVQSAVGFSNTEEKVFQYKGRVIRAPIEQYYPPQVPAQIAFLKANDPRGRYKDRVEHSGDPTQPVRFIIDGLDLTDPPQPQPKEKASVGRKR